MMDENIKLSDDEEDLEALRRAALQSIKKKQQLGEVRVKAPKFLFGSPGRPRRGTGKFRGGGAQWGIRNGNQNWGPPPRNTNLISIPVVSNDDDHRCHQQQPNHQQQQLLSQQSSPAPKLILPQDRYCNKNDNSNSTKLNEGGGSKFDRYDNSDEESEESDDDDDDEEDDDLNSSSPRNGLKRSSSLDALMEELENEIQGSGGNTKEQTKEDKVKSPVVKRKKKNVVVAAAPAPVKDEDLKVTETIKEEVVVEVIKNEEEQEKVVHPAPLLPQLPKRREFVRNNVRKWSKPPPLLPPPQQLPLPPPQTLYAPPPMFYQQPPPQYAPPPMPMYEAPPPMLPPLMINTELYHGTQPPIMAPLSPRSAAFVLENRAIIEKRKRRSYSRSPSPRRRRSKSPLPQRRRSSSPPPLKQRPLSPKPRPPPPAPKKPPIRERLGTKPSSTTKPIKPLSSEPPPPATDPVLEARKKKFESNELKIKEGVIRLKSSESKPESETLKKAELHQDDLDEEALLDGSDDFDFDLDIKSDVHLFSDEEESDSDNEGRFKTKLNSGTTQRLGVLPFTKLTSGDKKETKPENNRNKNSSRSRSPLRSRQQQVKAAAPVLDNRKIEIKLKNPAKYEEKTDESRSGESTKRNNEDRLVVTSLRKVELGRRPVTPEADENNGSCSGGGNGVPESDEGDLRAQLSRKRAERQQKQPSSVHAVVDAVPTRLLKSALQCVGFKNSSSRKSSCSRAGKGKTKKCENKEGKLPIHLRLGAAGSLSSEVQYMMTTSTTSPKKSRKHKRVSGGTGGSSAGGVGATPSVEDKFLRQFFKLYN